MDIDFGDFTSDKEREALSGKTQKQTAKKKHIYVIKSNEIIFLLWLPSPTQRFF